MSTKIVHNSCYGGFSLSHKAMLRYAELKGITIYPEKNKFNNYTYWLDSPEVRKEDEYNTLSDYDFDRTDPILVQVVEQLGKKADGNHAKLTVTELKEGTYYRMEEYDGIESVMTIDDYEWIKA